MPDYNPSRDLDDWAFERKFRVSWSADDLARLLSNRRAAAVLAYVHSHPQKRLGNTIAFAEMYLGRSLSTDEVAGFRVRLSDFELYPQAFEKLIKYADGLLRIADARLGASNPIAELGRYSPREMPADRLCWFLDAPANQWTNSAETEGRRRDWNLADYRAMPKERFLAYTAMLVGTPNDGSATDYEFSQMVFQRPIEQADVVSHVHFVPREMRLLQPAGFFDLCEFVGEQHRIGEVKLPENWREVFPDISRENN